MEGNIYLDEIKISSEHTIHEYTYQWDRTVQQKKSELRKRNIELMKQTSLWNEMLNDPIYVRLWQNALYVVLFQKKHLGQDFVEKQIFNKIQKYFCFYNNMHYICNKIKEN